MNMHDDSTVKCNINYVNLTGTGTNPFRIPFQIVITLSSHADKGAVTVMKRRPPWDVKEIGIWILPICLAVVLSC